MDEALDAFGDGHEGAELGDLRDGPFDDGAGVDGLDDFGEGVAERLLEAEPHALGFRVDREDLDLDLVAHLDDVGRLADLLAPGHFGDVDEAFDAGGELDEGAEIGVAGDDALDLVADLELLVDGLPRVRLELLEADGNAAFGGVGLVDFEDLDLEFVAHRDDVGGSGDAGPAHVGNVQEGVGSVEVDKGPEVGEGAHGAGDDHAFGELGEARVAGQLGFLLEDAAAVDDRIGPAGLPALVRAAFEVERGDADADFLAYELLHFGRVAGAGAGEGRKARMPISTVRPPLTTPVTVPATVPPASKASSSEL